ncbi:MAG: type II toxin-antitoxin system VapC family toxin [Hyphomicrobiales bacterium]|nr:type II toxin-antitoxin system VapC family toxin [Hyphomicrobiales bacterium]
MLLDTCILIDVLRGKEAALAFVAGLPGAPALSAVTVTELVAGCRNVKERRQVDRLLSQYVVQDIGRDIAGLAGDYIRRYGPSHGTDPIDALIAATAKLTGLPLATLNLKHFPMFAGLRRPYRA